MKLVKTRLLALVLVLALVLSLSIPALAIGNVDVSALAASAAAGQLGALSLVPEGTIVVLHTNDAHTAVSGIETDEETGETTGVSYASIAALKSLAASVVGAENVTLVDAGDFSQGGPLGTLSKGEYLVEAMNAVGYDIATIGNHEFDYEIPQMVKNLGALDADIISCNFVDLATGEPYYAPYVIKTYGETKIAFVGITTPEAFSKSTPTYFQDGEGNYIYGLCQDTTGEVPALYAQVQTYIDAALAEGADYVIAVGHLGTDASSKPWTSEEVIANTTGLTAFIDGHSHSVIENQLVKDASGKYVVLAQTGTKLENVGLLAITPDGTVYSKLITNFTTEDPVAAAKIAAIEAENEELLNTVVANTAVDLTIKDPATGDRMVRSQETNLGDLCADAYRILLGADLAFVNGGGVRANIEAGDITYNQILNVHPFGNAACLVEVSGQQIADALEMGYRCVGESESGGFLQVSGLKCTINTAIASSVELNDEGEFIAVTGERRVSDIRILDQATGEYAPIDPEKTYKLASHNYMLKNKGDGYSMFGTENVGIILDSVMLDNQVLINYIVDELGGVVGDDYSDPYGQGRITIVSEAAAPAAEALNPNPVVVPSTQKLAVNGVEVSPAAYNCDGYNFFKIRDLAALLSATSNKFNVSFDEAANSVVITIGEAYEAIGGELTPVGEAKAVVVSSQGVILNGKPVSVSAYNIDGYNYFKLRDLGAALGFEVDYDEATATMLINTGDEAAAPEAAPAGSYADYLKAFVASCADISADQALEFNAGIDAGKYNEFPVVMLFEQTPDGGYWFGEPALTEAEFNAQGGAAVADHPSTGAMLDDAPAAEGEGAAPEAAPAEEPAVVGGWTEGTPMALTEEQQAIVAAFVAANPEYAGYKVISVLGTQVVAGLNVRLLCETPEGVQVVVTVYRDLSGNVSVPGVEPYVPAA